ncbi:MAG: pantetheine-phosphate adenylyltransferase [Spirochaetales bacterium]|nr:pantetheine-phosphate adenylyltransferase [Spirochaetales bacterium]
MIKAAFPGSFDPPTLGHLNLIKRASGLFDSLDVIIADNAQKKHLLTADERLSLMKGMVDQAGLSPVRIVKWDSLIVDYCRSQDIKVMVRGLRPLSDFGYEFELSMINKTFDSKVETVFLPTDPKYFVLRASSVRELVILGGDVSRMVTPEVEALLKEKLIP